MGKDYHVEIPTPSHKISRLAFSRLMSSSRHTGGAAVLKEPQALHWTSVFVSRAGCLHVYRIISVAPCPLVGSFTTDSPARINLLITSKQTGILWLGFGYPPTSLWRFSDSIST